MGKKDFFEAPNPGSVAKMNIAVGYFKAWASIMQSQSNELTYLDLCSGRGRYKNGAPATPLRILDAVREMPRLQDRLRISFYESNSECHKSLSNNVRSHPTFDWLKTPPDILKQEVNADLVTKLLMNACTFTFIDPCGYLPISVEL
ncbi:MAG: three-Cys-motif partner protein TcmP, partial [candidate division Zixibacteria bacterium]